MTCRSAVKPIFVGLGAAAVLAAGGPSALAAPSPSPSASEPASPAPGGLDVDVFTKPANPEAGDTVDVTTTIEATGGAVADVRIKGIRANASGVTLTGACTAPFTSEECAAGDLSGGEDAVFRWKLEAPEKTEKVEVTVTVAAAGLDDVVVPATVSFVLPSPSPTPTKPPPTPTETPTKPPAKTPPKKPSKTPSKTPSPPASSSGSSSGGGSGGGGSAGGTSTGAGSTGSAGSAGSVLPPQPNSSFGPRDPQVALPPIDAPSPSVAPGQGGVAATPQSRLQGNEAPVAQDLTFERMASTQVAWLSALLVAFSLLLTQLRLGRRRVPAGAAGRVRPKGAHRRPRRGLFGR